MKVRRRRRARPGLRIIGSRWRMTRSGGSLRMQTRIAVEAVIGSSPRDAAAAGVTAATGSRANRMIRKPMVAFQKPITIQGSVTANSTTRTKIDDAEAAGRQRDHEEPDQSRHRQADQREEQQRRRVSGPAVRRATASRRDRSDIGMAWCFSGRLRI